MTSVLPGLSPGIKPPAGVPTGKPSLNGSGGGFVKSLSRAAAQVNNLQLQSAKSGQQLVTGSASSLHHVVLEAEEASLSLQLMVAVRNKALDAYQEVMRMQV